MNNKLVLSIWLAVAISGLAMVQPYGNDDQAATKKLNDFSVPGTESFKTEFSDDGGAHWVLTLQGTAHKISQ